MSVDLEEDFSSLWIAGWQLCRFYLGPCHWSMKMPALYFLRHMGSLTTLRHKSQTSCLAYGVTCCNTAKNQISTKFHYFQLTTGQFPLVETVKVGICLVSRSRRVFEFATNLRQLTNFVEYTTPIKTPKTAKKAHKDPIISLRPLTTNKTQDMQMTSPRCPISPLIGHSTICVSAAIGSLTRFLLSTCIIHDFTLNFDFTTLII